MSMPIQRQSEAYGIFDDGPRYARDRASTDLPRGLAGLLNSTGPRIQAGLLNTRIAAAEDDDDSDDYDSGEGPGYPDWLRKNRERAGHGDDDGGWGEATKKQSRQAGWHTPDYDPRVDGYGGGHYGPSAADMADFAEEDAENERRRNYPRGQGAPWDYDKYGDPDPDLESLENTADPERFISGNRRASRLPFDRAAARRQRRALADPAADPAMVAPQMPMANGLQPAHRVGLDWRDSTIPGTVIGVEPNQVHIRWDDGQYTSEDPTEVHLL